MKHGFNNKIQANLTVESRVAKRCDLPSPSASMKQSDNIFTIDVPNTCWQVNR